jgi:hypothetical protein
MCSEGGFAPLPNLPPRTGIPRAEPALGAAYPAGGGATTSS